MRPIRIGLTGAMGAGKSEAARAFRRLGAAVYDADILGHYALANSVLVKDGVKRLLGEEVFDADGSPNRKLIAERVFSDANLLEEYEKLLHPQIRHLWTEPLDLDEYERFIADDASVKAPVKNALEEDRLRAGKILELARREFPACAGKIFDLAQALKDSDSVPVVVEAALLYEKRLEKDFDFCVDVGCSEGLRRRRLEERGMSARDISQRDAFQFSPEKKASLADAVLFNESDRLFLQVQAVLILSRFI